MYKKILCTILLMMLVLCGCGKKKYDSTFQAVLDRKKLIIGVRVDAKPFGFIGKDGYNYGLDVDLGSYIAKALLNKYDNAVEYVPVTAQNRISVLNAGKVDMLIAAMSITENRKKIMDFSVPYYEAGQAVMVPHWSKIASLKELDNKRVIIVYGSTGENSVRRALPNATVIGYKNYDRAVAALKAGEAQAIIADDSVLLPYVYDDKSLKLLPGRYSVEPYAIAFRKGKESQKLREFVDFFLQDYAQSGKLIKLQQKWGVR